MVFKPAAASRPESKIQPISAEPHVSTLHEGVFQLEKSSVYPPSTCNEVLNKAVPTTDKPILTPFQPSPAASKEPRGQGSGAQNAQVDGLKIPNLNLGTGSGTPKTLGGASLLTSIYPSLAAIAETFRGRLLQDLGGGNSASLLDGLNAALVECVQLRWGAQRVTQAFGHGQAAFTEQRVVGPCKAETDAERGAFAADLFAADIVFLEFLNQARGGHAAADLMWDRSETRIAALAEKFQALAAELATLQGRFEKAEAIQAAGGWTPDKLEAAMANLAKMADRMATLYYVIDRFRPDLLPAAIAESEHGNEPNPVMAHFNASGGYIGLIGMFGQTVAAQLHHLAVSWHGHVERREALGAEYKQVLRDAQAQEEGKAA